MIEKFGNHWFNVNDITAIEDKSKDLFNPSNPDLLIIIAFLHDIQVYLEGDDAKRCLEKFKKSR